MIDVRVDEAFIRKATSCVRKRSSLLTEWSSWRLLAWNWDWQRWAQCANWVASLSLHHSRWLSIIALVTGTVRLAFGIQGWLYGRNCGPPPTAACNTYTTQRWRNTETDRQTLQSYLCCTGAVLCIPRGDAWLPLIQALGRGSASRMQVTKWPGRGTC